MRHLFILSVLFTAASCSTIKASFYSLTTIGPRDSFVLGANAHDAFSVRMRNVSRTPVTVRKKLASGEISLIEVVQPGETIALRADANAALIFENGSDRRADIKLTISGDTNLAMTYER
jgi:hypothetical protein